MANVPLIRTMQIAAVIFDEVFAVRGVALEPVPKPGEGAYFLADVERVGIDRLGKLRDDRLPDVVVRRALRRAIAGHGVQPELEGDAIVSFVTDEPGL